MLNERGAEFTYREYTKEPLSADEITEVLSRLGMGPHDVLRARDAKALGIDGAALSDQALIEQMSKHPTLLQRPILDDGTRAALGRPVDRLLEVLG